MQRAVVAHRHQVRKGSDVPYISHPAMVALLLQRYGFEDEIIAAGLLHDVVEDTPVTEEELAAEFGPHVAELVHWVSETKKGPDGHTLPWEVRKQTKIEKLRKAPLPAKAVALADKLHNLFSTLDDVRAGLPIWTKFNAPKERCLWDAERIVEICSGDDPRLGRMAGDCRSLIEALRQVP